MANQTNNRSIPLAGTKVPDYAAARLNGVVRDTAFVIPEVSFVINWPDPHPEFSTWLLQMRCLEMGQDGYNVREGLGDAVQTHRSSKPSVESSAMARIKCYPPPFKVGQRIKYVGSYGWTRGSATIMVNPGDVGVVRRNRPGSDARPDLLGEDDVPLDGYSVVVFHDGSTAAVSKGDANYRAVR